MSDQTSLTLADVLKCGHADHAPIPAETAAIFLAEWGDVHLFIGHITEAEANGRLAAKDQTLSGLLTVRGDFTHRWGIFERHEDSCDALFDDLDELDEDALELDADDFCRCEDPWYVRWVDAATPGAIAVTTAFADADWDAEVGS